MPQADCGAGLPDLRPNVMAARIHPKAKPVIVHAEDDERWLTARMDEALALVAPYPSQLMAVA